MELEMLPDRAHAAAATTAALQGLGQAWVGRTRRPVRPRGWRSPRALFPKRPAQKPGVVLYDGAKPGQAKCGMDGTYERNRANGTVETPSDFDFGLAPMLQYVVS